MADSRHAAEGVTEEFEGRLTRTTRLLSADLLIRREAEASLAAGYDNSDLQGFLLVAARRLAIDGTTPGHREAVPWLVDHADNALAFRLAQQIEGVHDAATEAPNDALRATERAARAAMGRAGKHEWGPPPGNGTAARAWPR